MRFIDKILILLLLLLALGCKRGVESPEGRDYRQDMRDFVRHIGDYGRQHNPDFAVVIQNGHDILLRDGEPAAELIAAIAGVARESLFYGYDRDDAPTPAAANGEMLAFTELARQRGLSVLVADYCSTRAFVDSSYARNAARGYASFAADSRDLDRIPAYPSPPFRAHGGDVKSLAEVRNFLYLINPGLYADRGALVEALAAAEHDLLIVDLFFAHDALTAAEVDRLQRKPSGGQRLVIAYMSIGEAEDYRYYWQPQWVLEPPAWLGRENPHWAGNYKVRYWNSEWQQLVLGTENSYLDRILAAGFDGVYLDIVDAFYYFETNQGD